MAVGRILSNVNRGRRIEIDWQSDEAGDVSQSIGHVCGQLVGVKFKPGGISGANAPENNYDVLLKDPEGVDVLASQGSNLSNTTATRVAPGVPFKDGTTTSTAHPVVDEVLTLEVSGASTNGTKREGKVVLYLL